jgi:hypothetical protein
MNENSLHICISRQNHKINVPLIANYVELITICFLFDSDSSLKCVALVSFPLDTYPVEPN